MNFGFELISCEFAGFFGLVLLLYHLPFMQKARRGLLLLASLLCLLLLGGMAGFAWLVLSALVILLPERYAIWCLVLMGIPNSVIYAGIWPLAIHDLGKWTNLGSSLLVMALSASAIFPLIKAGIVDSGTGLQMSYWILMPSFLYMMYYAFSGHKINKWS